MTGGELRTNQNKKISTEKLIGNSEKKYALRAFWFAWIGFAFWVLFLAADAVLFLWLNKRIFSDTVLVAITTATTINLFSAFVGVIRGLFPPVGKKK